MEGTSDMERKGCESIGCWARYVILTFELTHNIELGFSRSFFFQIAISQEWEGRMTSNKRDVNRMDLLNWNKRKMNRLDFGFSMLNFENNYIWEITSDITPEHGKNLLFIFYFRPCFALPGWRSKRRRIYRRHSSFIRNWISPCNIYFRMII